MTAQTMTIIMLLLDDEDEENGDNIIYIGEDAHPTSRREILLRSYG